MKIADFKDPAEVRLILERRSVRNKIAIAIDCDMLPVGTLPAVTELVRAGIIVWIDRGLLRQFVAVNRQTGERRIGINCDVYLLTPAGIALCDAEGIAQH
jgi:hypothetical protein